MSSTGEKPKNLVRQRIFITVAIVVALGLAIMTIYSTLSAPRVGAPTVEVPKE
jgi:hypothetical protein